MKKFTIACAALFVVCFIGMVGFVALSEDFVAPGGEAVFADENSKIWKMSFEEVVSALEEQGFITVSSEQNLASSGLCSDARKYNGAELYYWDLDVLDEESDEYKAYESLQNEGCIDLYGMGIIISPKLNGPYAILLTGYEGDIEALEKAFLGLGV